MVRGEKIPGAWTLAPVDGCPDCAYVGMACARHAAEEMAGRELPTGVRVLGFTVAEDTYGPSGAFVLPADGTTYPAFEYTVGDVILGLRSRTRRPLIRMVTRVSYAGQSAVTRGLRDGWALVSTRALTPVERAGWTERLAKFTTLLRVNPDRKATFTLPRLNYMA